MRGIMKLSPPPERMARISGTSLGLLLCVAILINWVPARWINPTFFQAGLFLMMGVWGVRIIYRPYVLYGSFALLPLGIAAGWGLLQLARQSTVSRWETWYAVVTWAGNFSAFFLALQVCHSSRVRRWFLQVLMVFGFVISVASMLQFFSMPQKIFWVFDDQANDFVPFQSPDHYAAFAELIMPIALVRALKQADGRKALWYTGIAATIFAAVIAGMSRAGALLIIADAIVVPLAAGKRQRFAPGRVRMTAASFALVASILTAVVGLSALLDRFRNPDPYEGRREMAVSALMMARERPWLGFGLGNFGNAYAKYAVWDTDKIVDHAHNDWAEWAAEGGLPFLGMIVSVFIWAVPRAFRSVWGIGILAVFGHSLVDFSLQSPVLEFWMFSLLGVLAAESARHKPTHGIDFTAG